MPRTIILDSFAVGSVGQDTSASPSPTVLCRDWVQRCIAAGNPVFVPAICYYETLREMERRGAQKQIQRLMQFCFSTPERFLPLETAHLELAAQLWAQARNVGLPTTSPDALDGDVILAAQSLALGFPTSDFVIATTNVGHLARFVPADDWQKIASGS